MALSVRATSMVLVAATLALLAAPGAARGGGLRCRTPVDDLDGDQPCGTLVVPLDRRSDGDPGTVAIAVVRVRIARPKATPILALTGDDSTADALGAVASSLDTILQGQGRDLYVFADRAAVLTRRCDAESAFRTPEAGARCAAALGSARRHLGSADVAEDAAAVVEALALKRVVVFATGGGAEAGIRFAAAHPERVERLIVDAPPGDAAGDPLRTRSLDAALGALRDICALSRCPADDVAGALRIAAGRPDRPGSVASSADLARVLLDGPLQRLPALPAALVAANHGDGALLRRLVRAARPARPQPWEVARACGGAWPWDPATTPAQRLTALGTRAAEPLPAEALVATASLTQACAGWPGDGVAAPLPVPGVPTLVTAGAWDRVGTPVGARQVHEALRGSSMTLLLQRDEGLRSFSLTPCGDRVLRRFIAGRAMPATCTPPGKLDDIIGTDDALVPLPASVPPTRLAEVAPARVLGAGRPGRVLAALLATLDDVTEEAGLVDASSASYPGLRGGRVRQRGGGMLLRRVQYVPGVVVSGAAAPPRRHRRDRPRSGSRPRRPPPRQLSAAARDGSDRWPPPPRSPDAARPPVRDRRPLTAQRGAVVRALPVAPDRTQVAPSDDFRSSRG